MTAIYVIMGMIEKVSNDKKNCIRELKVLERSDTIFKKFARERAACRARIETLNEIEKMLKLNLRRAIVMDEMEP